MRDRYQVPLEKISELAKFDGSLIVERTKGEVISRCDMEAANFLALNMMHEIVTGNMTAEQARDFLTETAAAYSLSRSAPHAERFMFDLPQGETNEPDHTTIAGAIDRRQGQRRPHRPGDERLNRVALITGVGPGLGAALARRFARDGFSVALVARTKAELGPIAVLIHNASASSGHGRARHDVRTVRASVADRRCSPTPRAILRLSCR